MLESARKLAQIYLWKELNPRQPVPQNLDTWFAKERQQNPQRFFPYLIESAEKIKTVFVLSADPAKKDTIILSSISMDQFSGRESETFPFVSIGGPNSANLGPLIKVNINNQNSVSPSGKTIKTTIRKFQEESALDTPWASYFSEILEILDRPILVYRDTTIQIDPKKSSLEVAANLVATKKTCFLTVTNLKEEFPGQVQTYLEYLNQILADSKYALKIAPPIRNQTCSLCFKQNSTIYPAACRGAGIDILNMDRDGSFPGVDKSRAYQRYALCLDCADLLYIFKFYVLNALHIYVAGAKAVLIPNLSAMVSEDLDLLMDSIQKYASANDAAINQETKILDYLAAEKVIASFDIVWADFGQKMENIRGMITDVFPSRLKALKEKNDQFTASIGQCPYAPKHWYEQAKFTLDLGILQVLFKRPGGKSAEKANDAAALKEFKNELAACIYKKRPLSPDRIWEEAQTVMTWYLKNTLTSDEPGFSLTRLTLAGWVRHFAVFLDYLYELEVIERMENKRTYTPEWEKLKSYFGSESAINTNEKAFAFVIGIYFGILLQVQEKRDVNVSTNALSWIRKPNFSGLDLLEIFQRSWNKIQDYKAAGEFEKKENFNKVTPLNRLSEEIGHLGLLVDENKLSVFKQSHCLYHLVLGIALTNDLLFKKEEN